MTKRFELSFNEEKINDILSIKKKQYDRYEVVDLLNEQQATISALKEENEQLRQKVAFFEEQEDEFEQYTAQTIQNMIANYRDD